MTARHGQPFHLVMRFGPSAAKRVSTTLQAGKRGQASVTGVNPLTVIYWAALVLGRQVSAAAFTPMRLARPRQRCPPPRRAGRWSWSRGGADRLGRHQPPRHASPLAWHPAPHRRDCHPDPPPLRRRAGLAGQSAALSVGPRAAALDLSRSRGGKWLVTLAVALTTSLSQRQSSVAKTGAMPVRTPAPPERRRSARPSPARRSRG
jgi:hypothetical protein